VILVDANLLVYAANPSAADHDASPWVLIGGDFAKFPRLKWENPLAQN
jgi:hypothetical protein